MLPHATGRRISRAALAYAATLALCVALLTLPSAAAAPVAPTRPAAGNPVTPGAFTGLGFDQCNAPTQSAMDAWIKKSPYRAVGIYQSGQSRACKAQPNLTPTWVATQLAKGWKLLPIHLGVQASCTGRTRYLQEGVIKSSPTNNYAAARAQGVNEANIAAAASRALGLAPGSTIFYDLEAWNTSHSTNCNASALAMLSSFTEQLHVNGFTSGVYSSGASGIKLLDNARVTPGNPYTMPDILWIADWNGQANVSSKYVRSDGWMPSARVHQYRGGHNETWGGVTINIDNNYLQLGGVTMPTAKPVAANCTNQTVMRARYPMTRPRNKRMIRALECGLKLRGYFNGTPNRHWGPATTKAVKSYQAAYNHPVQKRFTRADWWILRTQLGLVANARSSR